MIFGLVGYVINNQQNQNTKKQNQLEEIRLEGEELEKESITGAEMTFDGTSHDFGAITEGDVVYKSFYFKNTGKSDLLIVDARAESSIKVKYPKNVTIAPGERDKILISFDRITFKPLTIFIFIMFFFPNRRSFFYLFYYISR